MLPRMALSLRPLIRGKDTTSSTTRHSSHGPQKAQTKRANPTNLKRSKILSKQRLSRLSAQRTRTGRSQSEVRTPLNPPSRTERTAHADFTKQYNRLRQHVAVRTGSAQGVTSALNSRSTVAALPAVNRPRPAKAAKAAPSASQQEHTKDKTENQLQALSKFSSRLRNLDTPYDLSVGVNRKGPSATANMKDKSDRATNEQVLDPRTRIILFKMIGRGLIDEVNGCVSTGKEVCICHSSPPTGRCLCFVPQANVYHALTPERNHLALKIYKTSILVFKDRDRYVSGEYRFRRGYR